MDRYRVTLTFTEPLLGTVPLNKELYDDYIASKAPQGEAPDELHSIEELTKKGTTGFHQVDGTLVLYDYVIKGFCKDACSMLRRVTGSRSSKLQAFKKVIDGLVFVQPRQIPIKAGGEPFVLERPLRAQTAQGERVALSRSVAMPVGTTITFDLVTLGAVPKTLLVEWLDYGALRGLGQWRNGGYGSFTYQIENAE